MGFMGSVLGASPRQNGHLALGSRLVIRDSGSAGTRRRTKVGYRSSFAVLLGGSFQPDRRARRIIVQDFLHQLPDLRPGLLQGPASLDGGPVVLPLLAGHDLGV